MTDHSPADRFFLFGLGLVVVLLGVTLAVVVTMG